MSRPSLRPAAFLAGLTALTLGLSACGSSGGQTDAPPSSSAAPDAQQVKVVASTDAWGSIAKAVGGNFVQVDSIINSPGQDPHGYEATPQNAVTVGDAKLIVTNGGGYDDFMTGLIQSSGSTAPVVDAVSISGLPGAEEAEHAHEHEGEAGHEHEGEAGHEAHDHGEFNEHVWYSLPTVQKVADQIAAQLGKIDPAQAEYFTTNARTVDSGVAQLTSKATEIGKAHPGARVAVTEPVPDHLLETAGVSDVTPEAFTSAVEEGTDPPAAVVAQTTDLFTAKPPVDALIVNSQTESASTDQIRKAAEAANVPVIEMSETIPEGVDDYMKWMNDNLDGLSGALAR